MIDLSIYRLISRPPWVIITFGGLERVSPVAFIGRVYYNKKGKILYEYKPSIYGFLWIAPTPA